MDLFSEPDDNATRLRAAGWQPYGRHDADPATWPQRQWSRRTPDGFEVLIESRALATLEEP